MRVLVSGQAALAVTLDQPFQVRALDELPRVIAEPNAATVWLFRGCTDVSEHTVDTVDQADALTEAAWASDRALRIFLMLLDPNEPEEELPAYVAVLNDLLANEAASLFVKERLAAHPLPGLFEFNRVDNAAVTHDKVQQLVQFVIQQQGHIQRARDVFHSISFSLFGSEESKRNIYTKLTNDGSVHSVVKGLSDGNDLSFLKLSITSKHRDCRDIIAEWIGRLQPGAGRRIGRHVLPDSDPVSDWNDEDQIRSAYSSHEVFSQVRSQQLAIIEKIKTRDISGAERLTNNLIKLQKINSTNEQIAKSLSYLAQHAKLQGVPELQVEWAKWAARENPADPITFGHLADALIVTGCFAEAEDALVSAERLGRHLYARSGRARILRLMGRYGEAREKFLAAAGDYMDHSEVQYALAGAAGCLKDMGRHTDAINEYIALSERFPFEVFIWNGLARALLDAGRIGEALVSYSKSDANGQNSAATVGRAISLSRFGRFDEAMIEFERVIDAYPNNRIALCGRAEALKLSGKIEEAIEAYEYAILRCPFHPEPMRNLGYLYLENGHPNKALELFDATLAKFAFDRASIIGRVNSLTASGKISTALNAVDDAIIKMPITTDLPLVRAKLLAQMGREADAIRICDEILEKQSDNKLAILLKSRTLYRSGMTSAAIKLVSQKQPITVLDWTEFAFKCLLLSELNGAVYAKRELEQGLSKCPFFRGRQYLRSIYVSVSLSEGKTGEALRILEAGPAEVSNLIALHVYAANNRIGKAKQRLSEIKLNGVSGSIISFADAAVNRSVNLRSAGSDMSMRLLRSGRDELFDVA